jgi:ATP-dependent DNA ligase
MSRRAGIMLCYPFEEKRLLKWKVPMVIVQPKLDGERCRAIINRGNVQLVSSELNEIFSVPHITEQLSVLGKDWPHVELDGELYIHGMDFSEIHSRVGRTENIHHNSDSVEFHIFDVVSTGSQAIRSMEASKLIPYMPNIKLVFTTLVESSINAIMGQLDIFISSGYEGIIVRNPYGMYKRSRSTDIMKFKPKKEDIYEIVGFKEELDKYGIPKDSLGAFICSGNDGTPFGIGTGFTADQRKIYWEQRESLLGMYCKVKYQNITPKHVPRFPVYVDIVIPNTSFTG